MGHPVDFHKMHVRLCKSCHLCGVALVRIGAVDSRLEGLNLIVDQVRGPEIGIVVRETQPGHCRISVRTYTGLNAAEICASFGGGGHADRAGGEIEASPAEALKRVEIAAAAYINKH